MIIALNISILLFGFGATVTAFGGDTLHKTNDSFFKRINTRGWIVISCIVITLIVGVYKEIILNEISMEKDNTLNRMDNYVEQLFKVQVDPNGNLEHLDNLLKRYNLVDGKLKQLIYLVETNIPKLLENIGTEKNGLWKTCETSLENFGHLAAPYILEVMFNEKNDMKSRMRAASIFPKLQPTKVEIELVVSETLDLYKLYKPYDITDEVKAFRQSLFKSVVNIGEDAIPILLKHLDDARSWSSSLNWHERPAVENCVYDMFYKMGSRAPSVLPILKKRLYYACQGTESGMSRGKFTLITYLKNQMREIYGNESWMEQTQPSKICEMFLESFSPEN